MIEDSTFNQMMQLMFGFCRNSNCTEATVRSQENQRDFETMNTVFTRMCPSLNPQLSAEELQAYGIDPSNQYQCPGIANCLYAHDTCDLRRKLFMPNGQMAYWPVLCAQHSVTKGSSQQRNVQPVRICPQGDYCQSAHSMKEILYHPLTFKTT